MTVVLLMAALLVSVLGSAAPAWANDGKRKHDRRDRVERRRWQLEQRRGAFAPDRRERFRGGFNGRGGGFITDRPERPDWRWRDRDDWRWRNRGDWRWRDRADWRWRDRGDWRWRGPFVVVPHDTVLFYPGWLVVLRPVYFDGIVLLPHRRYRVIERDLDSFLIIFDTGNLTIVLRG
jgi:hypothetical protein